MKVDAVDISSISVKKPQIKFNPHLIYFEVTYRSEGLESHCQNCFQQNFTIPSIRQIMGILKNKHICLTIIGGHEGRACLPF